MTGKRQLRGTDPLGTIIDTVALPCPLCGRPLPNDATVDEHHLLPRSKGGRDKHRIHRICHRKIHATLTETELARSYTTWAALQSHQDIAAFVSWVASKAPSYYDNSRRSKR